MPDKNRYIAKKQQNAAEILAYERILADGLRDFLFELATINGGTMVSYINNRQHAHLDDIIGSSTELILKPGRLHYSRHAAVEFDWGKIPSVAIALELRDPRLTAYFRVVFGDDYVGVDISGIEFAEDLAESEESLGCFARAVTDARLKPVADARATA